MKNLEIREYTAEARTKTYGGRYPSQLKLKSFKTLEEAKAWVEKQKGLKSVAWAGKIEPLYKNPLSEKEIADLDRDGGYFDPSSGKILYRARW